MRPLENDDISLTCLMERHGECVREGCSCTCHRGAVEEP